MDYNHQPLSQRSSSEFSKETLLEKDERYLQPTTHKSLWSIRQQLVLHGILITLYSFICFVVVQKANSQLSAINSNLIESPARSAISDVQTVFKITGTAVEQYFGNPPTPEIDARWDDIIEGTEVKFTEEQMTRWGRVDEGVRLTDGSGYMGTLNVFHELHCLKRVYMYIHKDYYYGDMNLTDYEEMMNMQHLMHCLESIRLGIQCHGDISPITYRFLPDYRTPTANWSSPHECKDWSKLYKWGKDHSFDPTTPGLVIHPKLGPAYGEAGDSRADRLGVGLHPQHQ